MSSPSPHVIQLYHPSKGKNQWVMIQAGAGAGKTTELVSRVISFAIEFKKSNGRFPKIVVTTFTIKATQELKERLLKASLDLETQVSSEVALQIQEWLLSPMVNITTIHSAVLRFLREKGGDIGLRSDFQVVEDPLKLVSEFLKDLYFKNSEIQKQVLLLSRRFSFSDLIEIVHACLKFRLSHNVLIAYTTQLDEQQWRMKLAETMQRLAENISDVSKEKLKTPAQKQAWERYQKLISSQFASPKDIEVFFNQHPLTGSNRFSRGLKDIEMIEILKQIKELSSVYWNIELLSESQDLSEKVVHFVDLILEHWIEFVSLRQKLALSDIESWGLFLSRKYSKTAEDFSSQWDYWYVDEYQDTSPLQVQILDALMGQSKGFFVGDPQQSIYLFRGSRPHVFKDRLKFITDKAGEVLFFQKNYRTYRNVLSFINQSTSKIQSQPFLPMESGKGPELLGHFKVAPFLLNDNTTPKQWIGGACVEYIKKLRLGKPDLNLNTIAILAPQSKELLWVGRELENQGLPYQLHSGGAFFTRRETLDCIMILRVLLVPRDDTNLIGLLHAEWSGFETRKIFELRHNKTGPSIFDQLQELFSAESFVIALLSLDRVKQERGIFWAWLDAIRKLGCLDYHRLADPSGVAEANIWKLVTDTYDLQGEVGFSWYDYYWDLVDKTETDSSEKDALSDAESNRVQLMTIHASKGLEFEHVILPYYDRRKNNNKESRYLIEEETRTLIICNREGLPPQARKIHQEFQQFEKEERDRVWYVGVTRAIESLYIPFVQSEPDKEPSEMVALLSSFCSDQGPHEMSSSEEVPDSNVNFKKFKVIEETGVSQSSDHQKLFTNWELFQKQSQGLVLHSKLERLTLLRANGSKITEEFSWLAEKFPVWHQRLPKGYPEWGYALSKEQVLVSRRIDVWGVDDEVRTVWVLDYKTGDNVNLETAWSQLTEYAKDLVYMGRVPHGYKITLGIVLIQSQNILERNFLS